MAVQENVIINFEVNYTDLENAQAELAKTGKIDTKGFQAIQSAIDTTATDTKGLIKTFKEVATASTKMGKTVEDAFGAGIQDALDEAGVSVDEFAAALKKTNAPATSLKKELAQLKEGMARMKAEGKDTGKEFDALRQRAGKLSDAIADANNEIKNAGSDTRGLDNVVGSISALAGGYAAVQGAAALFGEENEDLQKTLVKVNGAMALATGVQQFYNATLKEGSLARLADTIATKGQAAATTLVTYVTTGATAAAKAYRIALLATGIGAVIVLVLALVDALESQKDTLEEVNAEIEQNNRMLEASNKIIERQSTLQEERAKAAGAAESELMRIRGRALVQQRDAIISENKLLAMKRDQLKSTSLEYGAYNKQIEDNLVVQRELNYQIELLNIQGTGQVKKELEERLKKQKEFNDKQKKEQDRVAEQAKADRDKAYEDLIAYENQVNKAKQDARDKDYQAHLEDLRRRAMDRKKFYDNLLVQFKKQNDDMLQEELDYYDAKWELGAKDAKQDDENTAKRIKNAELYLSVASQAAGILNMISQQKTENDRMEIESERNKLNEQLKAGAISQKQFNIRQKQLENAERAARQRQAEREKQAAVFQAVLAIPKAFLQGLSQGGIYLAAVYAALAAAEAAIIISKPVPKFFRGKKDKYEGPGVVADMGAELVERDGRMYLYTKPTQTYLGANDKVYTAQETRNIMHNTNINTTVRQPQQPAFDYDRLGKAIPRDSITINVDKDYISEAVASGLSKNNYFTNRYQFRK